ncbi:MAG: flagellar biosynthesis anti-sigma factor FlgM [Syntrophomonadales bacterium]|jgi:negative regulator of flagellin synthesis FlgM
MKISSSQVQSLLKVYGKTLKLPNQSSRTEGGRLRADNVTISGEGKLMQKAIQAAHLAEDIRQDKVEELREAITTGVYEVSPDDVAEQMIYRTLVDRLV